MRQITDQEQWSQTFRCKIIGSTNKKEDGQPHLIVLSRQTQSLNLKQQIKKFTVNASLQMVVIFSDEPCGHLWYPSYLIQNPI